MRANKKMATTEFFILINKTGPKFLIEIAKQKSVNLIGLSQSSLSQKQHV